MEKMRTILNCNLHRKIVWGFGILILVGLGRLLNIANDSLKLAAENRGTLNQIKAAVDSHFYAERDIDKTEWLATLTKGEFK